MKNSFINVMKCYAIHIGLCIFEIIRGIGFEIGKSLAFNKNLVYDSIIVNTAIESESRAKLLAGTFNFIPGVVTLGINKDNEKYSLILNCIDGNSEETVKHFTKVKECFENNLIKLDK